MRKKRFIAGIDVGTTKVCSVIAQIEKEEIRVLGTGWSPSTGLKKGVIVNLLETIESIKDSLEQAEKESETEVGAVYVSVGGAYIRGLNNCGQTEIKGRNGEIVTDDIARAIAEAKSCEMSEDYEIFHVLTQSFSVDDHHGIINPLGMAGRKLYVNLHLVLNSSSTVQNMVNAVNRAGAIVNGVVTQPLASAEAILSPDEKELGTIVMDIGGGTTDIAVYAEGSIRHSEVLPMGGDLITKDIAIGLKVPLAEAEQLKKEVGTVFPDSVPPEELIEVREVGTGRQRTLARRALCKVIRARCDEILGVAAQITQKVGLQLDLMTGTVITGGGSLLDGLVERAEQTLHMPVRIGYPINVVSGPDEICHPAYSTALGLLRYAKEIQGQNNTHFSGLFTPSAKTPRKRIRNWLFEKIG